MKTQNKNCSFSKRLAAIFYDSLLLLAVFFFSTLFLLPFTHGEAIMPGNIVFDVYLLIISYLYFVWQWMAGGQTLGMRAWKIRLEEAENFRVSWKSASIRFFLAILSWLMIGAGFLWALLDHDQLAFHDRYSGTRLRNVPNH